MTFHHWLIRPDPYNDPYIKPGRADIIPGYVSSKFHQGQPVTGRTIFLHGFSPGKSWGVFFFGFLSILVNFCRDGNLQPDFDVFFPYPYRPVTYNWGMCDIFVFYLEEFMRKIEQWIT